MTLATSRPTDPSVGRWQRLTVPAVSIGALAATTLALHFRDPHSQGSWGVCPSYALFGVYCPGCGGLRAVNDLTNFDVLGAASSNLVFVLSIPLIAFLLGRWVLDRWRGVRRTPTWAVSRWPYVTTAVLLTIFTMLRNLPAGSWLAP